MPSDVAAALVCLVNIQTQKQIACRNELMKEGGGIYEKDKKFLGKLWSTMKASKANANSRQRQQKMLGMDIETGTYKEDETSLERNVSVSNRRLEETGDSQCPIDCDQRDQTESNDLSLTQLSNNLTDEELSEVLAMLNSQNDRIMSQVRFSEDHQDGFRLRSSHHSYLTGTSFDRSHM